LVRIRCAARAYDAGSFHLEPLGSPSWTDQVVEKGIAAVCSGTIDEIQRLHIRKVPLHEQPRRIAHQAQTRTLAVLTEIPGYTIGADEPDKCSLRLLDDQVSNAARQAAEHLQ